MKPFSYYLNEKLVKRASKDPALGRSLRETAEARLRFAGSSDITTENARFVLEDAYEALREAIDAKLAEDGFKSFSHEASIAYLMELRKLPEGEVHEIDRLRKIRNNSKYRGTSVSVEEGEKALDFAKKL